MAIDYEAVGQRIRALREEHSWSQEKLAERAKISSTYQSNIERADKRTTQDDLVRMAAALGTTVDRLLTGSQPSDNAAWLDDMSELMAKCPLNERRVIMAAATAIHDAFHAMRR